MMDKDKQIELIKEWRAESKKNWISLSTATDVNRIYTKCADQLQKLVGEVAEILNKKGDITMRKIILEKVQPDTIPFGEVDQENPIFAKQNGELRGMIVEEDDGWILRIGGKSGATGIHKTLRKCIESCLCYNYEFFIE